MVVSRIFSTSSKTASAWWTTSASATTHSKTLTASSQSHLSSRLFILILQHRRIFQHVRKNHESDLRASNINFLELFSVSRSVGHCNVHHLNVHVVFGFREFPPINFTSCCFDGDDVAFSLV